MRHLFDAGRKVMFETAWAALDDAGRSMLLEHYSDPVVPATVASVLVRAGLSPLAAGMSGPVPPVHWPVGLRDFLRARTQPIGEDLDCE